MWKLLRRIDEEFGVFVAGFFFFVAGFFFALIGVIIFTWLGT